MKKILIVFICAIMLHVPTFAHENLSKGKEILEEIKKLKEISVDINIQIKNLEQKIHYIYARQEGSVKNVTPLSSEYGWHKKSSWDKLKKGMSEQQVISILGPPTKIDKETYFDTRKLYYQGEVKNSGYVSGNVSINKHSDRMSGSWPPVFE
ncbi:MAG: hypothetical protein ACR2PV_01325 [Gammaproteobacteria bacterium]